MAEKDSESPLRIWKFEGKHHLSFDAFELTWETFEEMDQEGGGYGWHGVMDALIRMKAPELVDKINFDPEASLFSAYSKDKDAIGLLAELMHQAIADPALLRQAIANADPELMD